MKVSRRFIYPPRPSKNAVQRHELSPLKPRGWKAQLKYNDDHILLSCADDEVELLNRRGDKRKFPLSPDLLSQIASLLDKLGLSRSEWNYLDGGLLHHKSKAWQNTLVLWDLLVADSEWLLGTKYGERYDRLVATTNLEPFILPLGGINFEVGYKVSENIFIPATFDDYDAAWDIVAEVNDAYGWAGSGEAVLEGVVAKAYDAPLELSFKAENNQSWSVRSRIATNRTRF